MDTTIICLGNRILQKDSAGPAVFDRLQNIDIPPSIAVIEGGTAGLNLLPLLEQGGRVIFVDAVSGFSEENTVVVLRETDIPTGYPVPKYGHEIGLPHVLSVLPEVCDGKLPEDITIIGIEGNYDSSTIEQATKLCLSLATETK